MAALSTWSSLSAPCQTIRPTGSSPGGWQGRDKAQPSSRLMMLVLRSSRLLTRKNSASRAASCAASRPSAGGPTALGGGARGPGGGRTAAAWARSAGPRPVHGGRQQRVVVAQFGVHALDPVLACLQQFDVFPGHHAGAFFDAGAHSGVVA